MLCVCRINNKYYTLHITHKGAYVVYGEAYATAEGVSQQEAMQRGAELQRFSASDPPHCVACRWLTSLGRNSRRIQRSLAVEANSALPPGRRLLSSIALLTTRQWRIANLATEGKLLTSNVFLYTLGRKKRWKIDVQWHQNLVRN